MSSTANQTAFRPYKILQQGRSTLQLLPAAGVKAGVIVLRFIPLVMVTVGIVLYLVHREVFLLLVFGGIALLEAVIFSFIKIPAAVSLDSVGFNLETLSLRGGHETYYLWNDVDHIRHRMVRGKNSVSLTYDAVLKSGKKLSFLTFGNYHSKKQNIAEINAVLTQISSKEVRDK